MLLLIIDFALLNVNAVAVMRIFKNFTKFSVKKFLIDSNLICKSRKSHKTRSCSKDFVHVL